GEFFDVDAEIVIGSVADERFGVDRAAEVHVEVGAFGEFVEEGAEGQGILAGGLKIGLADGDARRARGVLGGCLGGAESWDGDCEDRQGDGAAEDWFGFHFCEGNLRAKGGLRKGILVCSPRMFVRCGEFVARRMPAGRQRYERRRYRCQTM